MYIGFSRFKWGIKFLLVRGLQALDFGRAEWYSLAVFKIFTEEVHEPPGA